MSEKGTRSGTRAIVMCAKIGRTSVFGWVCVYLCIISVCVYG